MQRQTPIEEARPIACLIQCSLHFKAQQGRTGGMQENPVLKAGLSSNHFRFYPFTYRGKQGNTGDQKFLTILMNKGVG